MKPERCPICTSCKPNNPCPIHRPRLASAAPATCTNDPNTCKVGFCDWPRCNATPATAGHHCTICGGVDHQCTLTAALEAFSAQQNAELRQQNEQLKINAQEMIEMLNRSTETLGRQAKMMDELRQRVSDLEQGMSEQNRRSHLFMCTKCFNSAWRVCPSGTPKSTEDPMAKGVFMRCTYCKLAERVAESDAAFSKLAEMLGNPTLEAGADSSLEMELVKLVQKRVSELEEMNKSLTWACEQREEWQKQAEQRVAGLEAALRDIKKLAGGKNPSKVQIKIYIRASRALAEAALARGKEKR